MGKHDWVPAGAGLGQWRPQERKKIPMNRQARLWVVLASALVNTAQAQFTYMTNNGAITITAYTGPGNTVTVPATTNGLPVTSIGDGAFQGVTNLSVVTLPNTVTNLGNRAFSGCIWLLGVNMPTNLPCIGDHAFWQCFQLTGITLP